MGRPKFYLNEIDRINALRKSKTKYMLNKIWHCDACERDYCLAAKWTHIGSKKHIYNQVELDNINL